MNLYKYFKSRKFKNAHNPALKELMRKDGHVYYTFVTRPLAYRFLIGMMNVEYAGMGVNALQCVEYLDEVVKYINANNSAKASYECLKLKDRILATDPELVYLQLGTVYALMDDENPEDYSEALAREKIDLWQKDSELKTFFLNMVAEIIHSSPSKLNKTILDASVELSQRMAGIAVNESEPKQEKKPSTYTLKSPNVLGK